MLRESLSRRAFLVPVALLVFLAKPLTAAGAPGVQTTAATSVILSTDSINPVMVYHLTGTGAVESVYYEIFGDGTVLRRNYEDVSFRGRVPVSAVDAAMAALVDVGLLHFDALVAKQTLDAEIQRQAVADLPATLDAAGFVPAPVEGAVETITIRIQELRSNGEVQGEINRDFTFRGRASYISRLDAREFLRPFQEAVKLIRELTFSADPER